MAVQADGGALAARLAATAQCCNKIYLGLPCIVQWGAAYCRVGALPRCWAGNASTRLLFMSSQGTSACRTFSFSSTNHALNVTQGHCAVLQHSCGAPKSWPGLGAQPPRCHRSLSAAVGRPQHMAHQQTLAPSLSLDTASQPSAMSVQQNGSPSEVQAGEGFSTTVVSSACKPRHDPLFALSCGDDNIFSGFSASCCFC